MPLNVALLGAGIFAKDVYAKVFESTSAVQLKKASSSRRKVLLRSLTRACNEC